MCNDIKMVESVKILNLEGSSILKNNLCGKTINKIYNIVFNQSLLLNKLYKIGLDISTMDTTRDIINVKFSYGYDIDAEQIKELEQKIADLKKEKKESIHGDKLFTDVKGKTKIINQRRKERKILSEQIKELEQKIADLKITKEKVRKQLYQNGFFLDFYKVKKDENKRIVKDDEGNKQYVLDERINYVYWFRTSAKARIGEVFFINEKLVDKINKWQQMGIEFDVDEDCKLVEMEAYKALTASSLESLIQINPRTEILVINDLESYSVHSCKLIKVKNDKCYTEDNNNYELKNTLFDGQALADSSLFVGDLKGKGMALLRQHMFKTCGFNTNIQSFFMDYCAENGLDYNTFTIKDRYGRNLLAKNIKLITTENSMKWEKFNATMEDWIKAVENDNNLFGIVKTEHESKYNNLQRMSYQMLNTLDIKKVNINNILKNTLIYTNNMRNNIDEFIKYLDTTKNEMNINQMLIDLYNRNKNIVGTKLFRDYKKYQIRDWKDKLKSGKLLINGDNLTIVGNPYIMLLHAVGQVKHTNNVLDSSFTDNSLGQGNTCYTTRFAEDEKLACFRNPHNAPNNIVIVINTKNEIMDKYFNFTDNIIAVNLIKTDFQDRANGSDQDSDFILTTNQVDIVNFAKYTQNNYPTIVNCIEQDERQYKNNMKNMADIDNALAKSKADIGKTSNMAQIALSWYMNSKNKDLADIVCICSVLAQVAIDNAKRKYNVNLQEQINNIKKLDCMQVKINKKNALPSFWKYTSDTFDINKDIDKLLKVNCFMCLLEDKINKIKDSNRVDNVDIVKLLDNNITNKYKYEQIQSILSKYAEYTNKKNYLMQQISKTDSKEIKKDLMDKINELTSDFKCNILNLKIKQGNMKILIDKFAKHEINADLINLLYQNNKDIFLSIFVMEDKKGVK
ncbi:hypothetical protein SAMN02745248_00598 [Hathewaya proteolytica DSM 3090]|uniref:Uncharacterized protein n=1 Tax=Hathewaya proteolytica DSM 3090 TaxID=1121331 RepID=A0A1M6L2G4_9CLOT|nr:hypothetical protein [Hathewaya proteolytica]SHJ65410.1 hypothetical protein SAMN02745248_00598 [Hathewaya proteolytica DSM 3090]